MDLVQHIAQPSNMICLGLSTNNRHGKMTFVMLTIIIVTTNFMFFGKFIVYFGPEALYY